MSIEMYLTLAYCAGVMTGGGIIGYIESQKKAKTLGEKEE